MNSFPDALLGRPTLQISYGWRRTLQSLIAERYCRIKRIEVNGQDRESTSYFIRAIRTNSFVVYFADLSFLCCGQR